MNNRIKELRKELGLTQTQFGERIGIKQTYVAEIESGRKEANISKVKAICLEFNVNQNWILYGKGEMFNSNVEADELIYLYDSIKDKIPRSILKQVKEFLKKAQTFSEKEWQALDMLADKILKDD